MITIIAMASVFLALLVIALLVAVICPWEGRRTARLTIAAIIIIDLYLYMGYYLGTKLADTLNTHEITGFFGSMFAKGFITGVAGVALGALIRFAWQHFRKPKTCSCAQHRDSI